MSSAARAVRKQTVASVNIGTDAKTKNKGKKMKKGKHISSVGHWNGFKSQSCFVALRLIL